MNDPLNHKQLLMTVSTLIGIIGTLSFLFVFEIPSILKSDGSWALIIMIPALFWMNWVGIRGFIRDWKDGFMVLSKGGQSNG